MFAKCRDFQQLGLNNGVFSSYSHLHLKCILLNENEHRRFNTAVDELIKEELCRTWFIFSLPTSQKCDWKNKVCKEKNTIFSVKRTKKKNRKINKKVLFTRFWVPFLLYVQCDQFFRQTWLVAPCKSMGQADVNGYPFTSAYLWARPGTENKSKTSAYFSVFPDLKLMEVA